MLSEVVDALLTDYRVRAAFGYLVNKGAQELLLLVQELGEHVRVRDLDLGIYLCLLDLDGRVDQGNLGVRYALGHAAVDPLLVENDAVNECAVPDGAPLLLLYLDVVQVDYCSLVVLLGY